MVRCLKVPILLGEAAKKFLVTKDWIDLSYVLGKGRTYLLFPLKKNADEKSLLQKFPKATMEDRQLETKKYKSGNLKDLLRGIIPEDQIEKVSRGFDIIGDIVILEIPPELEKFEQSIAWTIKKSHKYINVVAKKTGSIKGLMRLRKLKLLIGNHTETIHKESGVRLKVDVTKAYFSPRTSKERIRIANQVKPGEKILVMFSGIAPYPLVILKKQPNVEKIVAVEFNHDAVEIAKENLELNKNMLKHIQGSRNRSEEIKKKIELWDGDVRDVVPKLEDKFDRIILMLPAAADEYLDLALEVAKKGTIIHMYKFLNEEKIPSEAEEIIEKAAKKANKKIKLLDVMRCGVYAPNVLRTCVEFKVL